MPEDKTPVVEFPSKMKGEVIELMKSAAKFATENNVHGAAICFLLPGGQVTARTTKMPNTMITGMLENVKMSLFKKAMEVNNEG